MAFPTETVYGLGADAFNAKAAAKIFEIKRRPSFDPLIVHIAKADQLFFLAEHVPQEVKKLINTFWPGPLTLVLKKRKEVPDIVTGGLPTVAVRMPDCEIASMLIKKTGTPIAAPSANRFSRISPVRAEHVKAQLGNGPDLIIDGGKTKHGLESTIVSFEKGKFFLLRAGAISPEEIREKTGIKLCKTSTGKVSAPGQLKKHYAPKAKLIIVKNEKMAPELSAAYIAFRKKPSKKYRAVLTLSPSGDLREAAANLFDFFHNLENKKIRLIYIEKVPSRGLGLAINDRIKRAAA
ncbi:MAG: L-threonylcarbamoyladenylate synthase [Elusimicrobiota bacterium]